MFLFASVFFSQADIQSDGCIGMELRDLANDLSVDEVVMSDAWEELLGDRVSRVGIVVHR